MASKKILSVSAGKHVTEELEELSVHYRKVPQGLKVQEKSLTKPHLGLEVLLNW